TPPAQPHTRRIRRRHGHSEGQHFASLAAMPLVSPVLAAPREIRPSASGRASQISAKGERRSKRPVPGTPRPEGLSAPARTPNSPHPRTGQNPEKRKNTNEPTELAENKQCPNSNKPTKPPIEPTGAPIEPTPAAIEPTPAAIEPN